MLEMSKTITLNGTIKINGMNVVYLNASLDTNNRYGANINKSIVNQDVYMANKEEIRKEVSQFESIIYGMEDEAVTEVPVTEQTETLPE